ncbi:hypothetical protein BDV26DRAFT_270800 [Aspergillus bertholletiae]|uniref:Uncharacterized protein n=1 Tax=Aspergillus bertholletiae TaxID=1226010 RepID=A0A5N7AYW0_9EURO|nr:hypothetical protein BDV26DRAFT_270800 [Aspergillus bertholletiae]
MIRLSTLFSHCLLHPIRLSLRPKIVGLFLHLPTLLLMTPPAEPEPIVEIIASLTAPFLATDPSGSVLHGGHRCSSFLNH